MADIVIVSGPPGAGKSTIARRLARRAEGPLAMHMHTDDMYAYVQKGFIPPWRPEAMLQNITLMNAMAASASICACEGYQVFIDGIVGPWYFEPWLAAARTHGLDLRYVLLFPNEEVAVSRAAARAAVGAMKDAAVVRQMWAAFRTYPPPPGHVIDTSDHSIEETVRVVRDRLAAGDFVLA